MPGLDPGLHVFVTQRKKDVDGRVNLGHDELCGSPLAATILPTELEL